MQQPTVELDEFLKVIGGLVMDNTLLKREIRKKDEELAKLKEALKTNQKETEEA